MVYFNDASPICPIDANGYQCRIVQIHIFSNSFHLALSLPTSSSLPTYLLKTASYFVCSQKLANGEVSTIAFE